jgi:outer membrane protein assembly factor BamA
MFVGILKSEITRLARFLFLFSSFLSCSSSCCFCSAVLFDNSFAFRLSGGYSGGANPQRFFMGGTENWINRSFSRGEIPLDNASDFAFLSPAMPMRGFDYAEKIGSKYSLINLELRMPLLRYLFNSPFPLFAQSILNTIFIDAGSAWDKNKELQLFTKNENGKLITKDLLLGTGCGARMYILYFLVRFDVAWSFDMKHFSKPKYYISLGTDF